MAEIIESQEEVVEGAVDITQETQQEEVVEQPQEEVVQEQAPVEENVPTKYKGKSLDEIIRMHQEAEKLIGRQAQEVGEVRKLADELIKRQLEPKQVETEATKEDEIDFFEDPKKYVSNFLLKTGNNVFSNGKSFFDDNSNIGDLLFSPISSKISNMVFSDMSS